MAIGVPDNFNYGGKKPNFDRDQFTTREAMLAFPADFLDEGHISYCKEDKKHYKWTGTEWVEFATGGGGGSSVGVNLFKSPNFDGSEWVSGEHEIRDDVVARANAVELPMNGYIGTPVDVEAGKRYTLSFTFFEATRSNSLEDGAVRFGSNISDVVYTNDVDPSGMWWEEDSKSLKLHGENLPQRVVCSFTALDGRLYIEFSNGAQFGTTLCQYWHVKLEEGDTATEWTDWKSDSLVSGFGIKTINGQSILGSGNIEVEGGGGGSVTAGAISHCTLYPDGTGGMTYDEESLDLSQTYGMSNVIIGDYSEDNAQTYASVYQKDANIIIIPGIDYRYVVQLDDKVVVMTPTKSERYALKTDLPTKVSELTNDSGYVTGEELATAISQSITNTLKTDV